MKYTLIVLVCVFILDSDVDRLRDISAMLGMNRGALQVSLADKPRSLVAVEDGT